MIDLFSLSPLFFPAPGLVFIKPGLKFYFISDGIYGFAEPRKTILEDWIGLRIPLKAGFITSIEAEFDYDSRPAEDAEKLSATYRFKLGYKF